MIDRKNQKHTLLGIEMVKKIFEEGKRIFTVQDAKKVAPLCGITDNYILESLHHLSKTGWIVRLKRGLYFISSSFPCMPPVHEFEIATALVHPAAISHWSALHFHGMTDQIPQKIYATTTQAVSSSRSINRKNSNKKSSSIEINGIFYEFIKTKPERFFGFKDYWVGEARIAITDPERTLMDGLNAPKYFGGWAEVYSAFELNISKLNLDKIVDYSLKFNAATAKRLGWTLEKLGMKDLILKRLEDVPIKGYRILDPAGPGSGHCNRKWMIQENFGVR